jgi:hypothetical protein
MVDSVVSLCIGQVAHFDSGLLYLCSCKSAVVRAVGKTTAKVDHEVHYAIRGGAILHGTDMVQISSSVKQRLKIAIPH